MAVKKKIPAPVETQDHMCRWDADQPTLQDKEVAADEREWVKWGQRPKDGYNKNLLERDQTQR